MQYCVTVLAVRYMLPSIPTRKFRTWLHRASKNFICYIASEIYNSVAKKLGHYKYEQYIVKHNSNKDFIKMYFLHFSFNDAFRL